MNNLPGNPGQGMRKPSISQNGGPPNLNNNNNGGRSQSPSRNIYPVQRPPPPPQNENPKNNLVPPQETPKPTTQIPPPPPPPPKSNISSTGTSVNGVPKSEPIPVINNNINNNLPDQSFSPKSRDKSEKSSWWPFKKKRSSKFLIS